MAHSHLLMIFFLTCKYIMFLSIIDLLKVFKNDSEVNYNIQQHRTVI